MPGCLSTIVWVIVEVVIGRLIDELIKRATGRRVRLGWLSWLPALFALFGLGRLRKGR